MRIFVMTLAAAGLLATSPAFSQGGKKAMSDAEARAICDQQFSGKGSGKGSNKYAKQECRKRMKNGG